MRLNGVVVISLSFLLWISLPGDGTAGELMFIHGIAEVYDASPTFVDAAGILQVRTDDDSLWDVSFGGMRSCDFSESNFGIFGIEAGKTRVIVKGELIAEDPPFRSKSLDVCKPGTYYNVVDSVIIGTDTVIMVSGQVDNIDAKPSNGDTMGLMYLQTKEESTWWIRFGTERSPHCTGSFSAADIHVLSDVQVAGILREDGSLEVCEEGTYIRDFNTAAGTGFADQTRGIHLKGRQYDPGDAVNRNGIMTHASEPVTGFSLNGRVLFYEDNPRSTDTRTGKPSGSLSLTGSATSPQLIIRRPAVRRH